MLNMRVAEKPQTIAYRVAVLVSVAILPVLVFAVFLIVRDAEQARDRYLQQLAATTHVAAQAIDVEIRRLQTIVETLREAPKLRERDLHAFYGFATAAVADYPGVRIALYDPSGESVFLTNMPFGEPLPQTAVLPIIQRVVAARQMAVADLYTTATKQSALGVLVPVVENGAVAWVLSVTFPPAYVSQILRAATLPNGIRGVLIDRNGIIIARTNGEAEFVGHRAMEEFFASLGARDEGFNSSHSLEGLVIRGAFVRSPLTGWIVSLGVEESVLEAPLRRALWQFGGGCALLAAGALAWALYHARRIARPVAAVATMARAMEQGEPLPVLRVDIVEIQVIADRLREASVKLHLAAAERGRMAEVRLRDRDLMVFRAISSAAEQTVSLQERLQSLMRAVEAALGFDGAAIWLLDPSENMLTLRAARGMPQAYVEAAHVLELAQMLPGAEPKEPSFGDIARHPVPRLRDILLQHGCRTSGRIPLVADGKLVGLLGLIDRHPRQLPADEFALLGALGQQMGAFIHQADLYEITQRQLVERTRMIDEIARRDRELGVYNAISSAAERTLELHERLRLSVDAALTAIGEEAGALYLLDQAGENLVLMAGYGYSAKLASVAGTLARKEGFGLPLDRGSFVAFSVEDYPNRRLQPVLEEEGFRIIAGVPLAIKGEAIGTFMLGRRRLEAFTRDEITTLTGVARQLAVVISHAKLYEAARHEIAEREKVQADLEDANRELESFSYSVSHDLRSPLRAIDGFSRILQEDYADKLDREGARVIGIVRASTKRMTQMIEDILAFSRAGRAELKAVAVDMQAVVRVAIRDLEPATAGRKVDFTIAELPPAYGDAPMLQQVWANLLGNAVTYTAPRDRAIIRIGVEVSEGETVYTVRDNGVGFDMRYADKLFGAFQRLHGAEFPGTGIGLSIVRRIITRHGGRVWAESEVDKGAAFFFTVGTTDPAAPGAVTRRDAVREPAASG